MALLPRTFKPIPRLRALLLRPRCGGRSSYIRRNGRPRMRRGGLAFTEAAFTTVGAVRNAIITFDSLRSVASFSFPEICLALNPPGLEFTGCIWDGDLSA